MPATPHHHRARTRHSLEPLEARIAPAAVLNLTAITDTNGKEVVHGQTINYTITVTNTGDTTATNVVLHTVIDSQTAFWTGDDDFAPDSDSNFHDDVANIVPGGHVTQTFQIALETGISTSTKSLTTEASVTFDQLAGTPPQLSPAATTDTATDKFITVPVYEGIYVLSSGVAKKNELGTSDLRVFDITSGLETLHFRAYPDVNGKAVRDSFRVALGDFNGDGYDDIVVSTAYGSGPIEIFDGQTGKLIHQVTPFNGKKGLFVAAGDVTGDGVPDIVVGSALGGGALSVIDGSTFQYLGTPVHPFGPHYTGSVRVAVADFDGVEGPLGHFQNNADEIVAGQGNFGNKIKIYSFDSTTTNYTERTTLTVGGANYRGGVNIAAGDLNGDGQPELVVGRNRLSAPIVDIFGIDYAFPRDAQLVHPSVAAAPLAVRPTGDSTIVQLDDLAATHEKSFTAFPASFQQGVRVSVGDVDADGNADILCTAGYSGGSKVKVFSGSLSDGYHAVADLSLTAFSLPLPAVWSAISDPVPSLPKPIQPP